VSGELSFTPSEDMLGRAYRLHYKGPGRNRIIGFGLFGAVLGLAIAMIEGLSSTATMIGWIAAGTIWAFFVLLVILAITRYWWMPRFIRRVYAQQRDLQQLSTIRWSEQGYETEIPAGKNLLRWTDIYRWQRGGGMLLLYRSEAMFNFFPDDTSEHSQAANEIQAFLVAAGVKEKK
jgi:hypothetical protein